MRTSAALGNPDLFSEILYERMKRVNPGVADMELYEFRYALDNLYPTPGGWESVRVEPREAVERLVDSSAFYRGIQLKPQAGGRIVLDAAIVRLAQMLFVGLVTRAYPVAWVRAHFYFDIRGFFFLHRTTYFTAPVLAHLGRRPFQSFRQKQKRFERCQDIGYRAFRAANAEVDQAFIESVQKLIAAKGTPLLLAIAGPTAAGKTEIVARLRATLEESGRRVTSIERDHLLTDRDAREGGGLGSTEAGGLGVNLQFCRVVVNYDLPWNPMRIEQRIGRVHRLGQTKPVLVVNLFATRTVEEHLLRLLHLKIDLFRTVIGDLDVILRDIERQRPLEMQLFEIFFTARQEADIEAELDRIQNQFQRRGGKADDLPGQLGIPMMVY